jgi:hypothetical protein
MDIRSWQRVSKHLNRSVLCVISSFQRPGFHVPLNDGISRASTFKLNEACHPFSLRAAVDSLAHMLCQHQEQEKGDTKHQRWVGK